MSTLPVFCFSHSYSDFHVIVRREDYFPDFVNKVEIRGQLPSTYVFFYFYKKGFYEWYGWQCNSRQFFLAYKFHSVCTHLTSNIIPLKSFPCHPTPTPDYSWIHHPEHIDSYGRRHYACHPSSLSRFTALRDKFAS